MTTVVIMQPTYMPWIGYLDLIDRADVFVLLDDVGYSHQSWQQRNRIKTSNGLAWLTVPVHRSGKSGQHLNEVMIANPRFWHKHLNSITSNYARAPYFTYHIGALKRLFQGTVPPSHLAALNISIIKEFAAWSGISTQFIRSSKLSIIGSRTERLISICRSLQAHTYLSPIGAFNYLAGDGGQFEKAGLKLRFQNYEHPSYTQCFPPFLPYASAIDLLLNEGNSAADIIRKGRGEDLSIEAAAKLLDDDIAREVL